MKRLIKVHVLVEGDIGDDAIVDVCRRIRDAVEALNDDRGLDSLAGALVVDEVAAPPGAYVDDNGDPVVAESKARFDARVDGGPFSIPGAGLALDPITPPRPSTCLPGCTLGMPGVDFRSGGAIRVDAHAQGCTTLAEQERANDMAELHGAPLPHPEIETMPTVLQTGEQLVTRNALSQAVEAGAAVRVRVVGDRWHFLVIVDRRMLVTKKGRRRIFKTAAAARAAGVKHAKANPAPDPTARTSPTTVTR